MNDYLSINDPAFDRTVSLRDAYRIMERVVEDHVARGEMSTVDLMSYLGLLPSGQSADPAAIYDFLRAVENVVGGAPNSA